MAALPAPLLRVRDSAISRIAGYGDRYPVAVLARLGIEYEQFCRWYAQAYPEVVRGVWGLASRRDVARLAERVSALEDVVRQLEAKVEKR